MKKQIKRISVVQNAKMMAVLYLLTSLPIAAVFLAFSATMGQGKFPLTTMLVFPIGYALGGFVGTVFAAWIYNLVAGVVGGFEFMTAEVKQS